MLITILDVLELTFNGNKQLEHSIFGISDSLAFKGAKLEM
ncbi:hypothetical protein JCM19301_3884 [Jejuia pallidilutea]|uniref:Uncharacterized protein n=1 Tax=Jejuia pallidilutea TaxID=504487 RepID=A0A090WQ22_9FLAO|nr:hypothetical protein JCM19301_3884 [Jejuia pallidilutea]GAL69492.1 hypothetical protein JCM19302_4221 [Jejuia pallidilutea]GAL89017.1 hypothetical protein JCM19538_2006 [Jejuia pallidilutea]